MTILQQMIEKYQPKTIEETKHAIKEVLQEVVLAGLSKTDFFRHAAFYGGTALRIFYGLHRFSEDLDFSLLEVHPTFDVHRYLKPIREVLSSLGLEFEVTRKEKSFLSTIETVYIKGNTKDTYLVFYPDTNKAERINHNEKITIKFEIDLNPPLHARTEVGYRLLPFPYKVTLYDKPSLFASKIHALIARNWNGRVKGRDLYDYIYYMGLDTKVNLQHLKARLTQSQTIHESNAFTKKQLIELLYRRFDEIDYEAAKNDITPFITDHDSLELWSAMFFQSITNKLIVEE
jgi:predicted nucleotidyltransferase component of viral defense system